MAWNFNPFPVIQRYFAATFVHRTQILPPAIATQLAQLASSMGYIVFQALAVRANRQKMLCLGSRRKVNCDGDFTIAQYQVQLDAAFKYVVTSSIDEVFSNIKSSWYSI